ncbi:MAG: hypothetical protein ACI4KF_10565 [Huintestinicola sp.]
MPDLTDFNDFELPPLPSLPKMPVKLSSSSETAVTSPSEVENTAAESIEEPSPASANAAESNEHVKPADADMDFELPPLRAPKETKSAGASDEAGDASDFELPPLPVRPAEDEENQSDYLESPELDDADYGEAVSYEERVESAERESIAEAEEQFDFGDYDPDADLDPDSISLDEMTELSDLTSKKEFREKNLKEQAKLNDLAMEVGTNAVVLDDLSDEYLPPEKAAADLLEQEKLDDEGKRLLKQKLAEDLQKVPENFNKRASQNMYDRLMEEKKMKIAKKGFGVSLIVVFLGFISAAISYLFLDWGEHNWFQLTGVAMVITSLLLFIKSKRAKIMAQLFYILGIAAYLFPGMGMYLMDPKSLQDEESMAFRLVMYGVAAVINVICVIILTKSESLNIYYTAKFSKHSKRR